MADYKYRGTGPFDANEPIKRRSAPWTGKVAECGTSSGYARHKRLGEEYCDPCTAANTAAGNRRRAARKARKLAA